MIMIKYYNNASKDAMLAHLELQRPSFCDLLTQNGQRHKSFNTSAVVRRLIASCHNQSNAFGAKLLVPTSLLLTNWRTLLSNYSDKIVVDFLPYGWPINYADLHFLLHHYIIILLLRTLILTCKPILTLS